MRSGLSISEYYYASQIVQGSWPYRDFSVEYPPVAMIIITLPRLIVSSFNAYVWAYSIETLLFDLVGIFLLTALSRELRYNPWKTLGIYSIALLAVGPLVVTRLDFIPAILTLLSIFFFVKRHNKTAWAFLAVATLTKIYPAVIAPVFLLIQINRKPKEEMLGRLAAFVITAMVITVPFILVSQNGLWDSFSYHAQRPLQIESTYASIMELLYAFKLFTLHFITTFGSINIEGPASDVLARISFGIMTLSLFAVYWSVYRKLKKGQMKGQNSSGRTDETAFTIRYCLVSVLVFILTCKVFSPQYIIWLLPLIPLIRQKRQNTIWILFVIVGIMTFFIFPQYYDGIRDGSLITITLLVLRNMTLIGIVLLLIHDRFLKAVAHSDINIIQF